MAPKVYVVHDEPDMSYYGSGEVYAVFTDETKAEAWMAQQKAENKISSCAEIAGIEVTE